MKTDDALVKKFLEFHLNDEVVDDDQIDNYNTKLYQRFKDNMLTTSDNEDEEEYEEDTIDESTDEISEDEDEMDDDGYKNKCEEENENEDV
jgi:hypothetical protein